MKQTIPPALPALLLIVLAAQLVSACTHTYTVQVQGRSTAGATVTASHWAQTKDTDTPLQQQGAPVTADAGGSFSVQSATVLNFAGPPPHIVLEVRGAGAQPLCAVVPTAGLWQSGEGTRVVELPEIRALSPEELSYELKVEGLAGPVSVIRMDPDKGRCIQPGG